MNYVTSQSPVNQNLTSCKPKLGFGTFCLDYLSAHILQNTVARYLRIKYVEPISHLLRLDPIHSHQLRTYFLNLGIRQWFGLYVCLMDWKDKNCSSSTSRGGPCVEWHRHQSWIIILLSFFFLIRNQLIRIICSLVCLTKPKVSLFRSISCQCFVILFVHVNEMCLAKHLGV